MGIVDLRPLERDEIVVHYGGSLNSVDAYTFANSLISLADTAREINKIINPDQPIEVRIEAIDRGSFRALLKKLPKGLGGFFSKGSQAILWSILAALIYDRLVAEDSAVSVSVSDDYVVITRGADRIIIPKNAYQKAEEIKSSPEIQIALGNTFAALETDEAIENFGLTANLSDIEPLIQVPRADFPRMISRYRAEEVQSPGKRRRNESARLVIIRPWLTDSTKKWSFEWNGVPISAPIKDQNFISKLLDRAILLGAGDALDAEIEYYQTFDVHLETFVNDVGSYEIIRVMKHIRADGRQEPL